MGDGYDSDTSGCSSSSEDLIDLASAVAEASAFMSILHTYSITGSHSNGMHSGTRSGSTPRRAGNRERCRVEGAAHRDADYFRRGDASGRAPTFNERNFERRSAVPHGIGSCTRFFEEKADCCGRPSATVVRLLNVIIGRKTLPQNFADLGDQLYH
jgi:hypothetical protein